MLEKRTTFQFFYDVLQYKIPERANEKFSEYGILFKTMKIILPIKVIWLEGDSSW